MKGFSAYPKYSNYLHQSPWSDEVCSNISWYNCRENWCVL